jgi:cytochrome c-type biogenesis protein
MFESLGESAFTVQLVVAFGAGVISFISPCVLPLLPGYLSMMSGYSASQLEQGEVSTRRMLRVIGLFILGFTLVFASIGAAATSFGQFLRTNLGTITRFAGILVIVFGILMVAMAVSNRGFLAALNQDKRVHVRPSRLGRWASPVMGAAFAFGWSPCLGPVLTVILATAAIQNTLGQGILLLVVYSAGLGLPFLLSGLGLFKVFGRLRPYLRPINIVSGLFLALFGVLMVAGGLGDVSAWFQRTFYSIPFLSELADI